MKMFIYLIHILDTRRSEQKNKHTHTRQVSPHSADKTATTTKSFAISREQLTTNGTMVEHGDNVNIDEGDDEDAYIFVCSLLV